MEIAIIYKEQTPEKYVGEVSITIQCKNSEFRIESLITQCLLDHAHEYGFTVKDWRK